jgi:hypothetical protein
VGGGRGLLDNQLLILVQVSNNRIRIRFDFHLQEPNSKPNSRFCLCVELEPELGDFQINFFELKLEVLHKSRGQPHTWSRLQDQVFVSKFIYKKFDKISQK